MFSLVKLDDTVKIQPSDFHLPMHDALVAAINCKYANMVILDVGLCLKLYDIVSIGDSFLHPGSAAQHVALVFRLIVFCPFIGEIIVGTVRSSSRAGIVVSVDFFNDILITPELMVQPTIFDESINKHGVVENVWYWKFNNEQLYMDVHEPIRFRVAEITFNSSNTFVDATVPLPAATSTAPSAIALSGGVGQAGLHSLAAAQPAAVGMPGRAAGPGVASSACAGARGLGAQAGAAAAAAASAGRPGAQRSGVPTVPAATRVSPMIIKGSINEPGLGLLAWWEDG